jgi:hypothetical protein
MRIRELFEIVEGCNHDYWTISKRDRKELGLRPELMNDGYWGTTVVELCRELLNFALRGNFPFPSGRYRLFVTPALPDVVENQSEAVALVERLTRELRDKLIMAETELTKLGRPPRFRSA